MPEITIKVNGKRDELLSVQERSAFANAIRDIKTEIDKVGGSDAGRKAAMRFAQQVLEEYVMQLHREYDNACSGSGSVCKLPSTKIVDIEANAAEEVLARHEQKGVAHELIEFGAITIAIFQEESHHMNTERLKMERRGEEPYQGMYG